MTQQEVLYEFYKLKPKYRGIAATESMLLANAPRPLTVQGLEATASRLEGRLAISGDYTRAYREFFQKHPFEDCDATHNILDRELHGDDVSLENLESLLDVPSIRAALPESTKHQEARAEQAHRASLIQFITQGKPTYGAWSKQYGQTRFYKSADLTDEPTTTLEEIANILREERGLTQTDASKKREAVTYDEFRLINPATGVEFTRKELINASKQTLKWLVFGDSSTAKPYVSARITAILKGQA